MNYFSKDYGIQLIRYTPFYAQTNGQEKASNKVLINILEKTLEDNPRDWHEFYLRPYGLIKLLKEILLG